MPLLPKLFQKIEEKILPNSCFKTSITLNPKAKTFQENTQKSWKSQHLPKWHPFLRPSSLLPASLQQFWKEVILNQGLGLTWPWAIAHDLLPGSRCLDSTTTTDLLSGDGLEKVCWNPPGCPSQEVDLRDTHGTEELRVRAEDGDAYWLSGCGSCFGTMRRNKRQWVQRGEGADAEA